MASVPKGQLRRAAGGATGRRDDPELVRELKRLVEPATLGDPMRPSIWVSSSMDKLAANLTAMGHLINAETVREELVKLGFYASELEGRRGLEAPGPERAIRIHQQGSCRCTGGAAAGHLRLHQEEGAGRQLQERGDLIIAQGRSAARERARLRGQAARQGGAVRRLRCDRQHRFLRQRRQSTSDTAEFAVESSAPA